METVEARTSGSGWEIASTMSSAQEKKKNPMESRSLQMSGALQSFTLDALCSPPTIDGLERTGKSAKGTSHSSKESKRIGSKRMSWTEQRWLKFARILHENETRKEKKKRKRVEEKTTAPGENLTRINNETICNHEKKKSRKKRNDKNISAKLLT